MRPVAAPRLAATLGLEMADAERRLGKRVAALRKRIGLTQAALAEAIGVATETISRLERASAIPSLARVEEIAGALRVPLHELFDFGDDATPEKQALAQLSDALRGMDAAMICVVAELAATLSQHWRAPSPAPGPVPKRAAAPRKHRATGVRRRRHD